MVVDGGKGKPIRYHVGRYGSLAVLRLAFCQQVLDLATLKYALMLHGHPPFQQ